MITLSPATPQRHESLTVYPLLWPDGGGGRRQPSGWAWAACGRARPGGEVRAWIAGSSWVGSSPSWSGRLAWPVPVRGPGFRA
jgi:hypothetical protein